jgi:hypothetical protein
MAKRTKRTRRKASRSASSAKRASLTEEEKAVALAQLGLTPASLSPDPPTWPYLVGGLMVLGALVLSTRLVTR